MRHAVCGFAALLLLAVPAQAEMSGGKIKIGVLTDLSGPYEQNSGIGSVEAAKMAEITKDTVSASVERTPASRAATGLAPRV